MALQKRIYVTILTLILIIGVAFQLPLFSINAFAATNPKITVSDVNGAKKLIEDVNGATSEHITDFMKIDGKTITLNMSSYSKLDPSDKQDVMKAALSAIQNNKTVGSRERTRLYNFLAQQDEATSSLVRQLSEDVNADFAEAYSWFKPFTGGISTVLGFLSLVIFALIGIMMVIDIAYLAIPPFKAILDKPSGEQPKFVSKEAFHAIKETEKNNQEYKSAMSLYLKLKVKQLIVLGICLLYLVGGKIYILISTFFDSFSGVIGD